MILAASPDNIQTPTYTAWVEPLRRSRSSNGCVVPAAQQKPVLHPGYKTTDNLARIDDPHFVERLAGVQRKRDGEA
jgi:hypothetical protein